MIVLHAPSALRALATGLCLVASLGLGLGLAGPTTAAHAGDDAGTGPDSEFRVLVDGACTTCHGGPVPESGLDLEGDFAALAADGERWRDLLERVSAGEMPPPSALAEDGPDAPRLSAEQRTRFLELGGELLAPAAPPRASTLRRLTRFQFEHSVEALLGVRYDASRTFPRDAAADGFDTVGDVMFLTDLLVEKYFDAAVEIANAVQRDDAARARLAGEPRAVVERLLLFAFRRPPTEDEVEGRLALVAEGDEPLRAVLLSILVSPHFLFRVESDHAGERPLPLEPHELAARLAFLVWGRGPDAELFELASTGALVEDHVLRGQLARLLDDPRSRVLADDFGAQWLGYRRILEAAVDFRTYEGFSDGLKRSMYEESARFFDTLVRADLSLVDLVAADWTFVDRTLAKHYGIEMEPKGFERVEVAEFGRGGVLGQGSVLTITSHPDRTSPVLRGAWVLDALLGTPPPPPPPDAGALPPERGGDAGKETGPTVRARLELHRAEARCASCHARIDPLGFALEEFDGVGVRRATEKGAPVDTLGVLPDGTEVDGARALGRYLAERPEALARAFVERLFVYGIGRAPEAWDEPAIEGVLAAGEERGWRTRALIEAFVLSAPFRERGVTAR
ncbi:hypothetical protein Pla163_06250 [Planctomycetes bacterium Pla163]|uniref:Planctomycete cytochrome C n=1 Tax=Rohdeia mirabilis TaxID=2528008 RepID=A0A518CWB9_9BACT|nr:hypothetical protein Pla163_06250 [Planctomycetes bacterium Pla163]